MSTPNRVTASRRVEAPPAAVFALLSDPNRHPEVDGSGMLVSPATPGTLTGVGEVFTMRMRNEEMGDYAIDNHVVEFEPDRRIAWEPVLSSASREEDREYIGNSFRHRWGYELEAVGPGATLVTEFFDCSRSPEDFRQVLRGGSVWEEAMALSLEKLEHQLNGTS
jgi:uncharacterized protein YndB with AHSA1/START domain